MAIEVTKPGLLTTLQDVGRAGHAHLGVGRAGAFDAPALRIANALCNNPRDACGLELTLLGPTLRVHDATWIAVTGAPLPIIIDGAEVPMWAPLCVPAGAGVSFGPMPSGCRAYLAVHGGIDVEPVLGSRSVDVNAALGPLDGRPLRKGDLLNLGQVEQRPTIRLPVTPNWRLDPRPWFGATPDRPLRMIPGRHLECLEQISHNMLFSKPFNIEADSNRVGVRLAGPALEWTQPVEMISEGCVPGLVQLPPSGQPIIFGPECPVSGGYPRIGQIAAVDLPRLAQRRPGDALRFAPCTLDEALDALRDRERALARLEAAIDFRLHEGSG